MSLKLASLILVLQGLVLITAKPGYEEMHDAAGQMFGSAAKFGSEWMKTFVFPPSKKEIKTYVDIVPIPKGQHLNPGEFYPHERRGKEEYNDRDDEYEERDHKNKHNKHRDDKDNNERNKSKSKENEKKDYK